MKRNSNSNFFPFARYVALLFFAMLLASAPSFGQTSLIICLPGNTNTQSIQQTFESFIGAGKVIAFGRVRDLENALATSSPACIIVPGVMASYTKGYRTVLRGKKGDDFGERYYIVATDSSITKAQLPEKRLAIVDFLGREAMPQFFTEYFNLATSKIKRANKNEDLLSMIGMEMVDGVILSASQLSEMKANTKLVFKTIETSLKPVAFPVAAVKEGASGDEVIKLLQKQSPSTLKELGIERWERQE